MSWGLSLRLAVRLVQQQGKTNPRNSSSIILHLILTIHKLAQFWWGLPPTLLAQPIETQSPKVHWTPLHLMLTKSKKEITHHRSALDWSWTISLLLVKSNERREAIQDLRRTTPILIWSKMQMEPSRWSQDKLRNRKSDHPALAHTLYLNLNRAVLFLENRHRENQCSLKLSQDLVTILSLVKLQTCQATQVLVQKISRIFE